MQLDQHLRWQFEVIWPAHGDQHSLRLIRTHVRPRVALLARAALARSSMAAVADMRNAKLTPAIFRQVLDDSMAGSRDPVVA